MGKIIEVIMYDLNHVGKQDMSFNLALGAYDNLETAEKELHSITDEMIKRDLTDNYKIAYGGFFKSVEILPHGAHSIHRSTWKAKVRRLDYGRDENLKEVIEDVILVISIQLVSINRSIVKEICPNAY